MKIEVGIVSTHLAMQTTLFCMEYNYPIPNFEPTRELDFPYMPRYRSYENILRYWRKLK